MSISRSVTSNGCRADYGVTVARAVPLGITIMLTTDSVFVPMEMILLRGGG